MIKKILIIFLALVFLNGCQTVKKKSDEIVERENQKFGQFIGKQALELKNELGAPTEDFINETGNEILVYKTKKYGIPCERKFEISNEDMVIGFVSKGCF